MSGFTVDEGLVYIANALYRQTETVRDLSLGLFSNLPGTLTTTSVIGDITTPLGGTGYAEIALTAGTWSVDAFGVLTYPQQQWIATGDWSVDVQGFFIRTTVTSELLHVQYRDDGAFPMTNGQIYTVDLSVDTS